MSAAFLANLRVFYLQTFGSQKNWSCKYGLWLKTLESVEFTCNSWETKKMKIIWFISIWKTWAFRLILKITRQKEMLKVEGIRLLARIPKINHVVVWLRTVVVTEIEIFRGTSGIGLGCRLWSSQVILVMWLYLGSKLQYWSQFLVWWRHLKFDLQLGLILFLAYRSMNLLKESL